jgi:hypothetical protein
MMIAQAVRRAGSEHEIYALLTAYVQVTGLRDELRSFSSHATSLTSTDPDILREKVQTLFTKLDAASTELNDASRLIVREALYVFGEALTRLKSLGETPRNAGSACASIFGDNRSEEITGTESIGSAPHACPMKERRA